MELDMKRMHYILAFVVVQDQDCEFKPHLEYCFNLGGQK